MKNFQTNIVRKKIFYTKKFIIFLSFLLIVLIYSTIKIYPKSRNALLKSREIKKELEEAENRKMELEKEITRLNSPTGEEEEIRRNLNVIKPGENVLIIVEKNEQNANIKEGGQNDFWGNFLKDLTAWFKNKF